MFPYIKLEWNVDRKAEFHTLIQEAAWLKRCQMSNLSVSLPPAPPFQWQTGAQWASPNTRQGVQELGCCADPGCWPGTAKMQSPCPLHALALYGQGAVVRDRLELQSRQVSTVARVSAISKAGDALIIVLGRLEAARFDMGIMWQGNCRVKTLLVLFLVT